MNEFSKFVGHVATFSEFITDSREKGVKDGLD
jgi:hypothetical protein